MRVGRRRGGFDAMTLWIVGGIAVAVIFALLVAVERLSTEVTDLRERLDATQVKLGALQADVEDHHGESSNA